MSTSALTQETKEQAWRDICVDIRSQTESVPVEQWAKVTAAFHRATSNRWDWSSDFRPAPGGSELLNYHLQCYLQIIHEFSSESDREILSIARLDERGIRNQPLAQVNQIVRACLLDMSAALGELVYASSDDDNYIDMEESWYHPTPPRLDPIDHTSLEISPLSI